MKNFNFYKYRLMKKFLEIHPSTVEKNH